MKIPTYTCKRCGWSWHPRTANPGQCPKCKSALWRKPKESDGDKEG